MKQTSNPADSLHQLGQHALPMMTLGILVISSIFTGAQFRYPQVLGVLRRDPVAFAAGEWWRLLTPLLVHADGWVAFVSNSMAIALIGPTVEQKLGRWRGLLLFLAGGLAGNMAGYAWEPHGAGSSVGLCGLLGGLSVWLLLRNDPVWPIAPVYMVYFLSILVGATMGASFAISMLGAVGINLLAILLQRNSKIASAARVMGSASLLGAVVLTVARDNHGPPIIAGACIAALMLWRNQVAGTAIHADQHEV